MGLQSGKAGFVKENESSCKHCIHLVSAVFTLLEQFGAPCPPKLLLLDEYGDNGGNE